MNCESIKERIALYLYDELDPAEHEQVETHVEACADCALVLTEERRFLESLHQRETLEVSEHMLSESRHDLMRAVYREERSEARGVAPGWWAGVERAFSSMRIVWQPAAAMALLAVGFFAGKGRVELPILSGANGGPEIAEAGLFSPGNLGEIQSVRVDPEKDMVEIAIEETTRRVITGSPNDPRIQSLLISTVLEYPNSGLRLDSLDVLIQGAGNSDVRNALIEAMVGDENPGVRLRALEALKPRNGEQEVRQALFNVLRADVNPGMRVQAIDMLSESPDREMVGLLQDLVRQEQNNYVRLQYGRVLRELNASVDHF
jgi:hypothetical protein